MAEASTSMQRWLAVKVVSWRCAHAGELNHDGGSGGAKC